MSNMTFLFPLVPGITLCSRYVGLYKSKFDHFIKKIFYPFALHELP